MSVYRVNYITGPRFSSIDKSLCNRRNTHNVTDITRNTILQLLSEAFNYYYGTSACNELTNKLLYARQKKQFAKDWSIKQQARTVKADTRRLASRAGTAAEHLQSPLSSQQQQQQ